MNVINSIIIPFIWVAVVAYPTNAQRFVNTPNDTMNVIGVMEDLSTLSIQQLNISSDTLTLQWKKVSEQIPIAWDASVCDNVICYAGLTESGTMNPIAPGDSGFLLLHITPHVHYGTAIVRYEIWDASHPDIKDTLSYILSVNNATGIHAKKDMVDFNIFPNPSLQTIDILTSFHSGFAFSIRNITGTEVTKGSSDRGSLSISTQELPSGLYILAITTQDEILSRKFLKR